MKGGGPGRRAATRARIRTPLFAAIALFALGLLLAGPGHGKGPRRVGLRLMVSHASSRPGPVDPEARDLDRQLRRDFRYRSLRVLDRRRLELGLDEIGVVNLPSGKKIRLRPLHVGKRGVLIAVDLPGVLQTDLRVPNHHRVVIGGQPYKGGRLIVTLEPDY